jgi:UDPglucose--hexose-1-phosphate uridylyltransferase
MPPTPNAVFSAVDDLVSYAQLHLQLQSDDATYCRSRLISRLGVSRGARDYVPDTDALAQLQSPMPILTPIIEFAVKTGRTDDPARYAAELLNEVCPRPSEIITTFDRLSAEGGIEAACDYLYTYFERSLLIDVDVAADNATWSHRGDKGRIDVLLHMSRDKLAYPNGDGYPACPLCRENVGFSGGNGRSRATLRTIPLVLGNDRAHCEWQFAYSPLTYFNRHFTLASADHIPMSMDDNGIEVMFDFLEVFPHYFLAHNAPIEECGATLRRHEHFTGGAHTMPYFAAKEYMRLSSPHLLDVRLSIPDWYALALRVQSTSRAAVIAAYAQIRDMYLAFSDEAGHICPVTPDGALASGLGVAARVTDEEYILDVFFRSRYADEDRPDGYFSLPPELACVKPGSLGMMEMMGYFILPASLGLAADHLKGFLTGKNALKELANKKHPLAPFLPMLIQLVNDNGMSMTEDAAERAMEAYINRACERMLAAVSPFTPDRTLGLLLSMLKDAGIEPASELF